MAEVGPGREGRRRTVDPEFGSVGSRGIGGSGCEVAEVLLRDAGGNGKQLTQLTQESKKTLAASATQSSAVLKATTLLAIPLAVGVALAVHAIVSRHEPAPETHSYWVFLWT